MQIWVLKVDGVQITAHTSYEFLIAEGRKYQGKVEVIPADAPPDFGVEGDKFGLNRPFKPELPQDEEENFDFSRFEFLEES